MLFNLHNLAGITATATPAASFSPANRKRLAPSSEVHPKLVSEAFPIKTSDKGKQRNSLLSDDDVVKSQSFAGEFLRSKVRVK